MLCSGPWVVLGLRGQPLLGEARHALTYYIRVIFLAIKCTFFAMKG